MWGSARDILPAIQETPCIAGVGAHDPALNLEKHIEKLLAMGFSGVTNEPFAGMYGRDFAAQLEAAGIGFSKEVRLIETAHRMGAFTVAWAFTPQEGRLMAKAGADVIGAIVGVTVGGMTGAGKSLSLEEATRQAKSICQAAKEVNPNVFVLTHGGPFKDPDTAMYSIAHTGAEGYAAGSNGERLPTEAAVVSITKEYKAIKLRA